ncbi:MAG: methyltransferase domain-containing protein [Parachlamydiales bacterium]|nr:methyltransferase domain-containing protein [Parachlamydiales bacterium]
MKGKYGLDAPTVVLTLSLFSTLGLGICALSFAIQNSLLSSIVFCYGIATVASLGLSAVWMVYSSKVLKPKMTLAMIDDLQLRSTDKILDIGCGRGLLLIEAAKRLQKGEAHGIDLWQKKDQSGNAMDQTLRNAKSEGVDIHIQTADMRRLPFPDAYFDAAMTSLAIHNIPTEEGRTQALREMLRVLKPGGKFCIFDIQHGEKYAGFLKSHANVRSKKAYFYCPPVSLIHGHKN